MNRFAVRSLALAVLLSGVASSQEKDMQNIDKALPEKGPAQPKAKRNILIYSKTAGFRHGSIGIGIKAFTMMGEKTGAYLAVATEDPSFFAPEKLNKFDAVLMLNTTGDCLRPKTENGAAEEEIYKKTLHEFVKGGKGLMGVHSATDTYHNWKPYNAMMGGTFISHPWNAGTTVGIKIVAPDHPLNAAFKGKDFKIKDEIYQFRPETASPKERLYLLTLDPDTTNMKIGSRKDGNYPISWVATYGKGRTFYCSLGHNNEIYYNPMILQHYLAGMQYVLGDFDVPATTTPVVETK